MKQTLLAIIAIAFVSTGFSATDTKFTDVQAQTKEFIGYYNSIKLSPEQEAIKTAALKPLPAPCCSSFSMATCCCKCNLSKSIWGLSNYLIAKQNYNTVQVREAAQKWVKFVNKAGYSGIVCSTGGCDRPFKNDGCGGMNENEIAF